MKNVFWLCLLFLIVSCVKESDIVTTETELSEPEVGETSFITGLVKDTLGAPIADAQIRFYFGDTFVETGSDASGNYEIEAPQTVDSLLIVAQKHQL